MLVTKDDNGKLVISEMSEVQLALLRTALRNLTKELRCGAATTARRADDMLSSIELALAGSGLRELPGETKGGIQDFIKDKLKEIKKEKGEIDRDKLPPELKKLLDE